MFDLDHECFEASSSYLVNKYQIFNRKIPNEFFKYFCNLNSRGDFFGLLFQCRSNPIANKGSSVIFALLLF